MSVDELKEMIRNLIEEVDEEEMDEASVTGNVDGYKTPHAFGKPGDEKEKTKRMAKLTGYSAVSEAVKVGKSYGDWKVMDYVPVTYDDLGSVNGGRIRLVNQNTMDTLLIQNDLALRGNTWWISTKGKRVQDKKPETVIQKALKLNEDIKSELDRIKKGDVIIIKNPDVKGPDYNTPVTFIKYNKLWNSIIAKNKDGKIVKIGIENDPSNEPYKIIKEATNRYHQLRKDEGTPNQKIGKGIREMRKQIQEIEKFVEWYSKIKTESDLDSSQYWKRTQTHLNVIRERLNKISQKIQNLSA